MTQATTDAQTADFMALAMEMATRARTIVLSHYGLAPDVIAKMHAHRSAGTAEEKGPQEKGNARRGVFVHW